MNRDVEMPRPCESCDLVWEWDDAGDGTLKIVCSDPAHSAELELWAITNGGRYGS